MHSNSFKSFSLGGQILRALKKEGYQQPTPIQQAAIPVVMSGKDLLATAQTGTGKTAAFALPMLHALHHSPRGKYLRALILTPTRELALQIDENLRCYGRYLHLRYAVLLGGTAIGPQIRALQNHPDILVATPGRLMDLQQQGHVHLHDIQMLVLDESDRMLDMGFIHDVRKIISTIPADRQTLLFSATLPAEILQLAGSILKNPVRVAVTPPASVSKQIKQSVYFVKKADKTALLIDILKEKDMQRVLVFTRTKRRADRLAKQLSREGLAADCIHSDKTQSARQRALAAFDRGKVKILIGTDVVARGIDVDGISHVINYEIPNEPESYVHRIGRTARAGCSGIALSLCDIEELSYIKVIEKLTKDPLQVVKDHPLCATFGITREQKARPFKHTNTTLPVPSHAGNGKRKPRRKRRPNRMHSS